jgi:hypothetical protein
VALLLAPALACGDEAPRAGADGRPLSEQSAPAREAGAAALVPGGAAAESVGSAVAAEAEELVMAETPPAPVPEGPTPYYAVQLGSYTDAAAAARTAAALTDSGWNPVVHPVTEGRIPRWQLYVAVARDSVLPEFVAAGVRIAGAEALVVRETFTGREVGAALLGYEALPVVPVPRLTSKTRWMLSPDSMALLAVEDGAGARGEARPDGVVYANERLDCYARFDSVWDVAPAPDWRRLAYGHVGPLPSGDPTPVASADGAPPTLVGALPDEDEGVVEPRRREVLEKTRPMLVTLPQRGRIALGRGLPTLTRAPLRVGGGWRVAWSRDGQTVYSATVPHVVRDDAAGRSWNALPEGGPARQLSSEEAARIPDADWVKGPTLDPSLPVVLTRRASPAARGRITSVGGWIRVTGRGRRGQILGPGVLLAATRAGNFVLALAPQVNALRDAPTAQLVVYATGSRRRSGPRICGMAETPG